MNDSPPSLSIRAYAKINLGLEVLGRRPDGLHEVATILQTIDLADRLRFELGDEVELHCRGMAPDPENLILRAAQLLRREAGVSAGCTIDCWKHIPIGAGLGGGSADAAATLLALNRLWGVRADATQLAALASQLGADVPFLVRGGTALATGTGRTVDPLPDAPRFWGVLAPMEADSGAKTAEMYRALQPPDFSDGTGIHRQAEAIRAGRLSPDDVRSAFTKAAAARWPSVAGSLASLADSEPVAVSLSGAGPSVFALYESRARARAVCRTAGSPAHLFRFVPAEVVSDPWVYSPNNP